jgi:RNA polymerase sigma-70 factor (ECF subfamily)
MVGNPDDADDVVQDVLLAALRSLHRFKGDSAVFTWLYRIMVNKAVSLKRRARRTVRLETGSGERAGRGSGNAGDDTGPGADLEKAERAGWVHAALRGLSKEHREVLVMRDFEGMRYKEIAGELGVPVGTVRSRLCRARLDLRYLLGLSPGERPAPGVV